MYFMTKPTYVKATEVNGIWEILDADDAITLMDNEEFEYNYEAVK